MIKFETVLQKFGEKGEKTGWTYIDIPQKTAQQIKAGCKKSFRVKGKIDDYGITALALTAMGEGNFILAVNGSIRKAIKKIDGAMVNVVIEEDEAGFVLSLDLIDCLRDEPAALKYFNSLPGSHKNWFSNWVKSAKTITTTTKRIATVVKACQMKTSFSEMMKLYKENA
ncbi:MAG: YdeI/OmpD-associated family protein [Ferruginibacter sp.]|nr:YdeI/OmpD-associated family protein [Ferruginibacter sp.]